MNKMLEKIVWLSLIAVFLLAYIATAPSAATMHKSVLGSLGDVETSNSFKSNITVSAVQNLIFSLSNLSIVELPSKPSQINPTALTIDVVRGFEPTQRYNSMLNATLARASHVESSALLKEINGGLSLFFNASDYPSYAVYNLSFDSTVKVSRTDLVSFAFSTDDSYNSSQAIIGVSLMIRDEQGNRYYVSVHVSDQYSADTLGLSEWFLGEGFTTKPPLPKYPRYSMRYGSTSGPWFKQLSLSESFTSLNLSTAWLDGLLVGGEIGIIGPPPYTYDMTKVDATFHFTLVHPQPFVINQQPVNSTIMVFPYQNSLNFSGILGKSVDVRVAGSLKGIEREELLNGNTISSREVSFDLSGATEAGFIVDRNVNITVFSRNVKNCLLTLDNDAVVDLTDALLSDNTFVYILPENTRTLKVLLILYRFNAWIFSFSYLDVINITKSGIVEEWFSTAWNEGVIEINTTVRENAHVAIRTDGLTPRTITLGDIEEPLDSMLIIDGETYFIVPLVGSVEDFSSYVIEYELSERPLYESSTVNPFSVHFNGSVFRIFTPFNVEGEHGFYIPLTVQMITYRTFVLRIEYDSSFFESEQNEIMAYWPRKHFEYFMLKPLQTGQSTIGLKIVDTVNEKAYFYSLFLVHVSTSSVTQIILYSMLIVTVLSIVAVFEGKTLAKFILRISLKRTGKA